MSTAYGADVIAARYCGMGRKWPAISALWVHGWAPSYLDLSAESLVVSYNRPDRSEHYLVATEAHRQVLANDGFAHVDAVGLPVVYLAPTSIRREPGSLLVMPPHSLPYAHHDWDSEAYADAIDKVRETFRRVVICIHPNCRARGYWEPAFQRRGYEIISGIGGVAGRVPLEWLRDTLSSFEFVTTNAFGSHIVYGAYFGCKVSVFGPWAGFKVEDYLHAPAYSANRKASAAWISAASFDSISQNCPFLVCEPHAAIESKSWAEEEVGQRYKRSPEDLRSLLGWARPVQSAVRKAHHRVVSEAVETIRRWTPEGAKDLWRRFPRHPDLAAKQEHDRLRALPPMTRGTSKLLGPEIEFLDSRSFLKGVREVFERQIYYFSSDSETPIVIDCGAGIGLTVIYAKALHPKARVVAFEPNPLAFEVLSANVRRCGFDDIELRQEAIFDTTGIASFQAHGGPGGRLLLRPGEPNAVEIRTVRLRDLLQDRVDFLRLDVAGVEVRTLEDCEGALSDVLRVFVTYRSFIDRPQQLDRLLSLLSGAGLRLYLEAVGPAENPFVTRKIHTHGVDSLDMITNVWAYRC